MVNTFKMETIKKDLLIVTPYRDRPEHLSEFLKNSPTYFDNQNISYDILLTELDQIGDWNAGLCVNSLVHFLKEGREYEWLYVHHVDVWPVEGEWGFPEYNTVIHNLGDYGSCLLKLEHFFDVNGYCNSFWGWGGEDNELYDKLRSKNYKVVSADNNYNVKYNTKFQNHERKFNGNNYGGGINNLFNYSIENRDNISHFYDHAIVKKLPNIKDNIYHQLVIPLKQSPREFKNENVLLGYINNIKDFMYVAPFVKSALIYAPYSYDVVIVVSDDESNFPHYLCDQLVSFGVKVIKKKRTHTNMFIDRFQKYKEFLLDSDYERCIHVDVTDSYFQSNPFIDFEENLFITSEGIDIGEESWNTNMLNNFYGKDITEKIKDKEVLCGGVIGGSKTKFIKLCDLIIEEYNRLGFNTELGIDQIILQKLIYNDNLNDNITIRLPKDNFCIHLHAFKHYPDIVKYKLDIQNNKVIFLKGQNKFCIVHQYNRINELYNNVINHFVSYFYPV